MTENALTSLLKEAETLALSDDWQNTLSVLQRALSHNPEHAGTINGIGTCLIQLQRPAEAVPYFEKLIQLNPEQPEPYINLGIACGLSGSMEKAESTYLKVLELHPEQRTAWKKLAEIYLMQTDRINEGAQILAALVQSDPQDVDALLLMGRIYEVAEDNLSAIEMYSQILKVQPGHTAGRAALQALSPQRTPDQAVADIQPDPSNNGKTKEIPNSRSYPPPHSSTHSELPRLAFYGSATLSSELRLGHPARALADAGYTVQVATSFNPAEIETADIFLFSNPHLDENLLAAMKLVKTAGKKLIIDLDKHFHELPRRHPLYETAGPGAPAALQELEGALQQANLVTTASVELAGIYNRFNQNIRMIPTGWSTQNELWDKPAPQRTCLHLGLLGRQLLQADAAVIRDTVTDLLLESQDLRLVIIDNFELLTFFSKIPDDQKLFLPSGNVEDYPFQVAQIDILLAPAMNSAFNRAGSALPLMQAGIRRIPWVASAMLAYVEYAAGGLIAGKRSDWLPRIRELLEEPAKQRQLGQAGRDKAMEFEISGLVKSWSTLLQDVS